MKWFERFEIRCVCSRVELSRTALVLWHGLRGSKFEKFFFHFFFGFCCCFCGFVMSTLNKLIFLISEKMAMGAAPDDQEVMLHMNEVKSLIGNSSNFYDMILLKSLEDMMNRRVKEVEDLQVIPFEIMVFSILLLCSLIISMIVWFKKETRAVVHLIEV